METYINKIDYIEKLLLKDEIFLTREKLQELKNTIIYDMAVKKCSRNNSKKQQLKSAKELLKNSKDINESRILFHKIYKYDNTFQLCDGFTAVVLKNMIDGLELNTADGEYFDCQKFINNCDIHNGYEEIKIDMLELEQKAIAVRKAKTITPPVEYQVHINNLHFNPIYLLRAIKILGTENVTVYAHKTYNKQPIYLKSELGESVVLPLTPPKDEK